MRIVGKVDNDGGTVFQLKGIKAPGIVVCITMKFRQSRPDLIDTISKRGGNTDCTERITHIV